jgi:hypothetical protein
MTLNQLACLQQMLNNGVEVPGQLQLKLKGLLAVLSSRNDTEFDTDGEDEIDMKAMEESSVALKARQLLRSLPY